MIRVTHRFKCETPSRFALLQISDKKPLKFFVAVVVVGNAVVVGNVVNVVVAIVDVFFVVNTDEMESFILNFEP